MSIQVSWLDDARTLILWQLRDQWSWDDLLNVRHFADQLIRSVDHPVHTLIDLEDGQYIPRIVRGRPMEGFSGAPNAGHTVMYGATHIHQGLYMSLCSLLAPPSEPNRFIVAESLSDALQAIGVAAAHSSR